MTRAIAPPSPDRLHRGHILLIGLCSAAYLMDGVTHAVLGPLAPDIARALHLSKVDLGPVFSANLVGQCVGLMFVPLLQGRFGPRRLIVWCVAAIGLCVLANAFVTSRDGLIALRLLTGVALGGALPSCLALTAAAAPASHRGAAIMALFTAYGGGQAVAGVIARPFPGPEGWRIALAAIGICALLCALAIWRWLKAAPEGSAAPAAPVPGAASPARLFSRALALGTVMLWVVFICGLVVNYCLSSWLPTLLMDTGRSHDTAGLSVSAFALGGLAATVIVGPLIDRFGAFRVLGLFLLTSAALLFGAGRGLRTLDDTALLTLLAAAGFFLLGAYGGVNVVLADYYPPALRAVGAGWAKSVGRLGTIIAPILIGLSLSAGAAQEDVVSLFALPALAGALALGMVGMVVSRQGRAAAA